MSSAYNYNQTETYTSGIIPNNANATSPTNARMPQVHESFDVMEESVEALRMNCVALEERLEGVLRREAQLEASGAPKEVAPTVVDIAQRINDATAKVHALNNQLNSILRRLEL